MITQLQLKKAIDMRNGSGMSWEAIADVIDEDLEELVRMVEKAWGKEIPRETWGIAKDVAAGRAGARPAGPVGLVASAELGVKQAKRIEGFTVVFDAGPPPPKLGDGRMAKLAQQLKPGAMVDGLTHVEFLSLRRFLTRLGMGSEFRWVDQKAGTVRGYVLAELSDRQKAMSVRMKEKGAAKWSAPEVKKGRARK